MSNRIKPLPSSAFFSIAANKVAGEAPCKDCRERHPGCACEKYKAWKAKRSEVICDCRKKQRGIVEANAVHHAGMEKVVRHRGEKFGTKWR
jgi:hypothetical protein